MSCVDRFYAIVKKDIFLTKKAVKQFFIYFFNDEGASSYLGHYKILRHVEWADHSVPVILHDRRISPILFERIIVLLRHLC